MNLFGRWYPLIPHEVQRALVCDNYRFKVVAAGRRSGKTERAKRYVVREMLRNPGRYFVAAPTRAQVKQIYWDDLKKLCLFMTNNSTKGVSESELTIRNVRTDSSVTLVGLDVPQRFEGVDWHGGIIDEIADVKASAWESNISPALDTLHHDGHQTWCWLIGVPDGFNHFYNLAQYAQTSNDPEWKFYHWKSSDILPPATIEAAKRRLSRKQFLQEYEASFETVGSRIYEDYGSANHTTRTLKPTEQILWCHDFNFTPMSSGVCVREKDSIYVVGEIILEHAIAKQSAVEFVEKYKHHLNKSVLLYGDPAGKAGEIHGHNSDYLEIEKTLRQNGWAVERRVSGAAPPIRDRQNAVRAKILSTDGAVTLFVNPKVCPWIDKAMGVVQIKEGSTFQETESDHQHVTTALGYMIYREFPILRYNPPSTHEVAPLRFSYFSSWNA